MPEPPTSVRQTERRPEQRDEIRARLADYRKDREALGVRRAELLAAHPDEWVALHDGEVFHSRELDALFAQLRLRGIEPARVPREFLSQTQPALLL